MKYAPIIIPTLNRVEHLARCIKSLQNNTWAKYTEIFISVDYPPSEKYSEGYERVCEYLKKDIDGFAKVNIVYQDKNLGPAKNELYLEKWVFEKYDRYIFTEDDNEFAINAIEYIDRGLELFENDNSIINISTSMISDVNTCNNIVKSHDYSAYGCGCWMNVEQQKKKKLDRQYFIKCCNDYFFLLKLLKKDISLLFALQDALIKKTKLYNLDDGSLYLADMLLKVYSYKEDKYTIRPANKRLVRNWGMDGSGVNCTLQNINVESRTLDEDVIFNYEIKEDIVEAQRDVKQTLRDRVVAIFTVYLLYLWSIFQ